MISYLLVEDGDRITTEAVKWVVWDTFSVDVTLVGAAAVTAVGRRSALA